jgi:hypothetical protein
MERVLEDWQHDYRAIPWEYPISDNNRPATYNQFITLRDTLVFSNKYYADKAWRSLIIWTKLDGTPTDTIEIREPNMVRLDFESSGSVSPYPAWQYVTTWWHSWISCEIVKKGRYRIQHKEQFNSIPSSVTRIHSYVLQHKPDGTTQPRAVFDWEWNTPWEIKRLTSFGYVECDLNKWDWLELKIEDQNDSDITQYIGYNSNWLMVEYIDLAYNI